MKAKLKKKIIKWSLLLLLGALLYWVWDRWDAWFEPREEAPYVTSAIPGQVILMLGESPDQRGVTWRCDTAVRKGEVRLVDLNRPADTLSYPAQDTLIVTLGGKSIYYHALLTSLHPGRTYRYAVAMDGTTATPWYTFVVPEPTALLSFLYIGDVHNSHFVEGRNIYQELAGRYPDALCWLYTGDIIDNRQEVDWQEWFDAIDTLAAEIPQVATVGNHEQLKGIMRDLDERWESHFYYPRNGAQGASRYGKWMSYGPLLLISLTTYELPDPTVLCDQYRWIERLLSTSPHPWKVVAMHHPAFSTARNRFCPLSRYLFRPLFEQYGVAAVLQGHDHVYGRRSADEADPTVAPLYVVSNISEKQYTPDFSRHFDRLGSAIRLYQRLALHGDTLTYASYTLEHTLYDSVTIVRTPAALRLAPHFPLPQEHLGTPPRIEEKGEQAINTYQEEASRWKERH